MLTKPPAQQPSTRRFAIVGGKATASSDFILDDLPGTSGRLDVLVRCLRPALLFSHGLRRDVVAYLVLHGGPRAPRVVRVDGAHARFLRPDERSLAVLLKKVLATSVDDTPGASAPFAEMRPGIAVARGGLEVVLADAPGAPVHLLDEGGADVRTADLPRGALFVVGDHLGMPPDALALLATVGATPLSVGPLSIHADDAVAIVTNELDRRGL